MPPDNERLFESLARHGERLGKCEADLQELRSILGRLGSQVDLHQDRIVGLLVYAEGAKAAVEQGKRTERAVEKIGEDLERRVAESERRIMAEVALVRTGLSSRMDEQDERTRLHEERIASLASWRTWLAGSAAAVAAAVGILWALVTWAGPWLLRILTEKVGP